MVLRAGKWTTEEEQYANILIELFEEGRVDEFEQHNNNTNNKGEQQQPKIKITNGMTLRAYLSRKLFCSPMRISKKFAGKGIGKLVYMSQSTSIHQQHHQQQQLQQQFPFSPGVAFNTGAVPLSSAVYWIKLNRLKEAESIFLRIAFQNGDPMEVVGYLFQNCIALDFALILFCFVL